MLKLAITIVVEMVYSYIVVISFCYMYILYICLWYLCLCVLAESNCQLCYIFIYSSIISFYSLCVHLWIDALCIKGSESLCLWVAFRLSVNTVGISNLHSTSHSFIYANRRLELGNQISWTGQLAACMSGSVSWTDRITFVLVGYCQLTSMVEAHTIL